MKYNIYFYLDYSNQIQLLSVSGTACYLLMYSRQHLFPSSEFIFIKGSAVIKLLGNIYWLPLRSLYEVPYILYRKHVFGPIVICWRSTVFLPILLLFRIQTWPYFIPVSPALRHGHKWERVTVMGFRFAWLYFRRQRGAAILLAQWSGFMSHVCCNKLVCSLRNDLQYWNLCAANIRVR